MELGGSRLEIALKWAQKANEIAGDELSANMIDQLKYLIQLGEQSTRFITLGRRMSKRPQEVEKLYEKLPEDVRKNPVVLGFMHSIRQPKKWPKKSVVIYCGSGPLKGWTPKSLETGIGGSEEAVIRVSKHLTDLGYKVTVFAEPLADDGVYDGVAYKNYWEISFKDKFDVFIAWRSPFIFDIDITARKKYLWIHDVMEKGEFTEERIARLDKVMLLSQYHRDLYPMIPDEKVMLTGNGIDPEDFEKLDNTIERDPHRIIYASSHVRGLENLYNMWPDIKAAVPDASLYVYYGWDSFDNVTAGNPERAAWKEKMVTLANELPDVHDEGRIGQDDIVRHTFASGIWAYPCFDFEEIYCITAVKAQAAGAYPVTTDKAALDENVQFGLKIPSDNYTERELELYKQELIRVLLNTSVQDKERGAMMRWARKEKGWKNTAQQWHEDFII
jgi:glycosyltransferase involved in cell wall biosynthesis